MNFYTPDKERQIGQQLATDFEKNAEIATDPFINDYLAGIANKLVENCRDASPLTVRLVVDGTLNAFSLPGGFIYIDSGLALATENEAQLAGVIAHEIVHVAARHVTKNASKQRLTDVGFTPAALLPGPLGYPLQQLRHELLLRFGSSAERQADILGMQCEQDAGYDPREFLKFLQKLAHVDEGAGCANPFSTCAARINRAQRALTRFLPQNTDNDLARFQAIRARIADLVERRNPARSLR